MDETNRSIGIPRHLCQTGQIGSKRRRENSVCRLKRRGGAGKCSNENDDIITKRIERIRSIRSSLRRRDRFSSRSIVNETAFGGGPLNRNQARIYRTLIRCTLLSPHRCTARPVGYCAHVRCNRMCKAHRAAAERDSFATCQKLGERRSKLPFPLRSRHRRRAYKSTKETGRA